MIGNSVWSSFDVFLQLSKYTVLQLFNLAAGETCHFHFVFHASPLILSPFLFLFSLNLFSLNERPLVAFVLAFRNFLCFIVSASVFAWQVIHAPTILLVAAAEAIFAQVGGTSSSQFLRQFHFSRNGEMKMRKNLSTQLLPVARRSQGK